MLKRTLFLFRLVINLILVLFDIIGHTAVGVFITNNRLAGWELGEYKQPVIVGHYLFWPALGFLESLRGGWLHFAGSLLRPFSPGRLWRAFFVILGVRYLAQEVYRRRNKQPLPPEVVGTNVEDADLTRAAVAAGLPDNAYMHMVERGMNDLFKLRVVTYTLRLPNLPSEFDGFTLVQLSDFHYGRFTSAEFVRCVVARSILLDPDVILLTGDYQTYRGDVDGAAALLAPIGAWSRTMRGDKGVLAVLGNHDRFNDSPVAVEEALKKSGIPVLNNRNVVVQRGGSSFYIAGVTDPWSLRDDMDLTMLGIPEGAITVLMCHVPDYLLTASHYPVALQLSGHNHGGQIELPLVGHVMVSSRYSRRYAEGFHKIGNTLMYANEGLGGYPPIRWRTYPEIVRFVLKSK